MPTESRESNQTPACSGPHPPPKLPEPLICPRCDSNNTKFCYYNNYSLSQPRHFCKACRRYWTHGGTLRNIPIGGGTRKNSKRSRLHSSSTPSSSSTATTSSSSTVTNTTTSASHQPPDQSLPIPAVSESVLTIKSENLSDYYLNLNGELNNYAGQDRNFCSLLNAQQRHRFMGMVGYASGFGYGISETGRDSWVYPAGVGGALVGHTSSGCNTWQQMGAGDIALEMVDADINCFSWPDPGISKPGKSFKF